MSNVQSGKTLKKGPSNTLSNTLDVKSKEKSNSTLLCDEWYDIKSDNVCFTKSANSPSQTNYSDPDSTPREFTALSSDSSREIQNNINTVHHTKNVYSDLENYGTLGLLSTPSISISGLDSLYNPLNSDLIDLSTIVCDTLNDECIGTARNSFYVENQEDFIYTTSEIVLHSKNKVSNFFKTLASDSLMNRSEDWGIDRSIYTVYSRSGFFADCHNADQLFHGEYLNHWGMEYFAECRMPLVFCIILSDKQVRKNEIQSSIVPLAINLLDRYMSKNKSSISKLIRFVYSKIKSSNSENSTPNLNDGLTKSENAVSERPIEFDSGYLDIEGDIELKNGQTEKEGKLMVNVEIVYNFVAAACYFIADRYNGLANVSVKALLMHWASTCKLFTKTKYSSYYIMRNKVPSLSVIMSLMFDVYSTLDYVITTPFVSYMVQNLIIASNDLPYPQNPTQQNVYQSAGSILSRIALIDDTFHRFTASIITLAIYSLVRRLARHDRVVLDDSKTWLKVDDNNIELRECTNLLTKTLSQFVNTEILDALTQPIDVENGNEDIFTFIIQGEARNMDLEGIRRISKILSN